jgi:muramoyltetrapeptide carboxypeptidase
VLYLKCKFKNAGVLHNIAIKHGISAIIGELLCRKISGLSPEATKEKLQKLGIDELTISTTDDDFIISFQLLKNKADAALQFLSPVFTCPEFSKNDLEYMKEKYPAFLELETSHPQELLLDKLMGMLYQNHNYGRNNTGTAQSIAGITEEDVHDFVKSNFSKDRLEFFVTGDVLPSEIDSYIKILFEKLPRKSQSKFLNEENDISSATLSEKKDDIIHRNDMENIAGVISGIRLDDLSKKEMAAAYIIIKTLFDKKTGDFARELKAKNIAYGADFCLLRRKFSNIFYFYVYIDKDDLAGYKEYVANKVAAYAKELNYEDLERTRNRMIAHDKCYTDVAEIDEKVKYDSLPFSEVTKATFKDIAEKLFDSARMRTVYIESSDKEFSDICRRMGNLDMTVVTTGSGISGAVVSRLKAISEEFGVHIPDQAMVNKDILAGADTDELRLSHLLDAIHSKHKIIWAMRGGYGTARLLASLEQLPKPDSCKTFVGFCDVTALHLFISQKWPNWNTIHAPLLIHLNEKHKNNFGVLLDILEGKIDSYDIDDVYPLNDKALAEVNIVGKLTGGNLTIVESSLGTIWEIQTAGKILFLEDVHEYPEYIYRMLYHLKEAGKLSCAKALVFGHFHEAGDQERLRMFINGFAQTLDIPVYVTDKFGHGDNNVPLIYNAEAKIHDNKMTVAVK